MLLVDDREENLLALESLLQNSTLELFKATSGNAALGLLIEREFALVLLDVQMPEMDGFEIAELMHGNAETRHVPIIFVSAINKEDRYVQKGHAMGAVDYLFKPIDPDILRAKVQVFCELYRQKQALQQEILERKQAEERRNWEVQVREAESVVRLKVASMDQTEGLCDVVGVIRKQLDRLGVKYDTCSIQIVNEEGTDFISIGDVPHNDFGFWTKILAGSWEKSTSHPEAYPWIIDVWKSGKPRYDPECGALGGKSLIDVPFSQGTLAINALHSHAFCQADVAVLQRFAEVLSEAYTRFRDLIRNTYLEDQLRQSQKMEAIGQLTAGMAHNFNNRLMVIMNSLELMAHQGGADPETLQTAETSTEQAAAMIEQLLHFARADKPLQLNPVDLSAVLQETLTLARQTIDPKMDIDYKLAVNLPPLFGDANQLGQVLMNLLLNARDALEEEAPTSPSIQVRADTIQIEANVLQAYAHAAPGPYIRIQVVDNGIGMDDETQERIFEPFFTTKEVDRGTGLGLATVYGIVQEHQGWIECESQPGVGTTFSIYLPVSREDPAHHTRGPG